MSSQHYVETEKVEAVSEMATVSDTVDNLWGAFCFRERCVRLRDDVIPFSRNVAYPLEKDGHDKQAVVSRGCLWREVACGSSFSLLLSSHLPLCAATPCVLEERLDISQAVYDIYGGEMRDVYSISVSPRLLICRNVQCVVLRVGGVNDVFIYMDVFDRLRPGWRGDRLVDLFQCSGVMIVPVAYANTTRWRFVSTLRTMRMCTLRSCSRLTRTRLMFVCSSTRRVPLSRARLYLPYWPMPIALRSQQSRAVSSSSTPT